MFCFHSSIGDIYIAMLRNGMFGLFYRGICYDMAPHPQFLADNVYCHATGCSDWNSCRDRGPRDLSEWLYVRVR